MLTGKKVKITAGPHGGGEGIVVDQNGGFVLVETGGDQTAQWKGLERGGVGIHQGLVQVLGDPAPGPNGLVLWGRTLSVGAYHAGRAWWWYSEPGLFIHLVKHRGVGGWVTWYLSVSYPGGNSQAKAPHLEAAQAGLLASAPPDVRAVLREPEGPLSDAEAQTVRDFVQELELPEPQGTLAEALSDVAQATLEEGRKDDTEKPRWDLIPPRGQVALAEVLAFGARKYDPDNWRKVPEARRRYYSALQNHLSAWRRGEDTDPESGLPHLAHAMASLAFLLEFDLEK